METLPCSNNKMAEYQPCMGMVCYNGVVTEKKKANEHNNIRN